MWQGHISAHNGMGLGQDWKQESLANAEVSARQPCWFKVVDFGTNGKPTYDFLLVINSNYGPILHRFWDTATYWLKTVYFATPVLFGAPAPYVPLGISRPGSAWQN